MPPPEQQVPRDPTNQPRVNNTNISWSHDKLCSSSTKRLNDRHSHYEERASLWHFEETTELKQLPTGFKRKFKNSFMFRTNAPMGLVCYGARIWIQNKNTRSSSTLIHFSKEKDHVILSSKKEEISIWDSSQRKGGSSNKWRHVLSSPHPTWRGKKYNCTEQEREQSSVNTLGHNSHPVPLLPLNVVFCFGTVTSTLCSH